MMTLRLIRMGMYDFRVKGHVVRVPSAWRIERFKCGGWVYHLSCHPHDAVAYMKKHQQPFE